MDLKDQKQLKTLEADLAERASRLNALRGLRGQSHKAELDIEAAEAKAANDVSTFIYTQRAAIDEKHYSQLADLYLGSVDRSRTAADVVQKASTAIGTAYTALIGVAFSVTDNPLPRRAIAPLVFLALAIVLSTFYLAFIAEESRWIPSRKGSIERNLVRRRYLRVLELHDAVSEYVKSRSSALRASVVSLGIGLIFLPAPFIEAEVLSESETQPVDWPVAEALPDDIELAKILYQAQVNLAVAERSAESPTPEPSDDAWIVLGLVGLAAVLLTSLWASIKRVAFGDSRDPLTRYSWPLAIVGGMVLGSFAFGRLFVWVPVSTATQAAFVPLALASMIGGLVLIAKGKYRTVDSSSRGVDSAAPVEMSPELQSIADKAEDIHAGAWAAQVAAAEAEVSAQAAASATGPDDLSSKHAEAAAAAAQTSQEKFEEAVESAEDVRTAIGEVFEQLGAKQTAALGSFDGLLAYVKAGAPHDLQEAYESLAVAYFAMDEATEAFGFVEASFASLHSAETSAGQAADSAASAATAAGIGVSAAGAPAVGVSGNETVADAGAARPNGSDDANGIP